MYNLNNFCNIIASLRKEKGWTQTTLAEKIGISPQSVSKWECGIGFPDVILFPVIAEVLTVPIGVLFGERSKEDKSMKRNNEYKKEFTACQTITVYLGNECRVEYVESDNGVCKVEAQGDPVFLRYFDVEQEGANLLVQIKNPSGSAIRWESYDREGYTGENLVRIYIGCDGVNINSINYLDLNALSHINEQGHDEVISSRPV